MGRSCPFPFPYNALGKSKPEIVRSLLLLAVTASRVTRRSSMPRAMAGAGLARRQLAPSGSGGRVTTGRGMRATIPMFILAFNTCPASGQSSPEGGSTGSLAHPLLSRLLSSAAPAARGPVVRLYVAVGRLTTVQWDPLGSIFPEAWAGGRVQVHHQDGQGRGALRVGMGIDRHGAARCVRQPLSYFLLLPRGAAKGQDGRLAVSVM